MLPRQQTDQRERGNERDGEPNPDSRPLRTVGDRMIDCLIVNTGPRAYRRPDGIAIVPLALLGP